MAACCDTPAIPLSGASAMALAPPPPATPQPWLRFAIALVLTGLSMQLSLGVNLSPTTGPTRLLTHGGLALIALLVVVLLGGPILRRSSAAARERRVTLEQLFFLGMVAAFAASLHSSLTGAGAIYYEVVSVLVAVYTLGQILVERQRSKVRSSLQALTDSLRTAVRVICCGKRLVVPISELEPGDRVLIEKGQWLPVDGTIVEGNAYVQEIAHTGEPFPTAKNIGDRVLAGTVALDGDLSVEVGDLSTGRELDRLAHSLESALRQRSEWHREADRWMTWFVPGVITIAICTLAFWLWRTEWQQALFNALAVLLVACPCGLGLGVPIALWHAMHRLAGMGIAPAGSELIERLARVRAVIFDKTDTLTEEQIRLDSLVTVEGTDATALRARLALIQSHCDHPVARPFSAMLSGQSSSHERLLALETLPGRGVAARVSCNGSGVNEVRIGNRSLLSREHETALKELRRRISATVAARRELFVFENGSLNAIALLTESVRPAVATLAPRLRALGLEVEIMTGDANLVERQWIGTGLDVRSGMTTAGKGAAVRAMEERNEAVLFIGDGLNDSEAMAHATTSLVLHGGDSTARAQAHGEISGASLDVLPDAIVLSRATRQRIRLILAISLAYNAAGLMLAATGWLHPVAAAAIMFASSLTVVALAGRANSPANPAADPPRRLRANFRRARGLQTSTK